MTAYDITIDLAVEFPLPAAEVEQRLTRAAEATLAREGKGDAALTILLTTGEQVHKLNRDFLGEDKTTDVLSFPAGEAMPGMEDYLGDVAIAIPVAQAQAEAGGHSLLDELALLTIHGVLHLLGYDHVAPEEQQAMWQVQDALLAELSLSLRSPHFDT